MGRYAAFLAIAFSTSSATAQEWTTDFNMGSFLAGGGNEASGYLSFECSDDGTAYSPPGQPYITLTPMAGVVLNKKTLPSDGIAFWVGDDQSFLLPMSVDPGGKSLSYDYSAESLQEVRWLVEALRKGNTVTAFAGAPEDLRLIRFTLDGSHDALEYIDGCIRDSR